MSPSVEYAEYRVISLSMPHEEEANEGSGSMRVPRYEAVLNEHGRNGWELVSFTYVPGSDRGLSGRNVIVLKRPLRDA